MRKRCVGNSAASCVPFPAGVASLRCSGGRVSGVVCKEESHSKLGHAHCCEGIAYSGMEAWAPCLA